MEGSAKQIIQLLTYRKSHPTEGELVWEKQFCRNHSVKVNWGFEAHLQRGSNTAEILLIQS